MVGHPARAALPSPTRSPLSSSPARSPEPRDDHDDGDHDSPHPHADDGDVTDRDDDAGSRSATDASDEPAGRARLPRAAAARGRAAAAAGGGDAARPPPQKWVQCAACNLWRRVPYELGDDAIPDDWTCAANEWDPERAACDVPQALTDDQIDAILALQTTLEAEAVGGGVEDEDEAARRGRGAGRGRGRGGGAAAARRAPRDGDDRRPPRGAGSGRDRDRTRQPSAGAPAGRARGGARAARAPRGRGTRATALAAGGGRAGGLSEAAEALLGMGFGADGEEEEGEGDGALSSDGGRGASPASGAGGCGGTPPPRAPPAAISCPFRPGDAVWAKVEGHDWWPARVVRRRAVPREVGPPPGGAPDARVAVPVVFFTAAGIPGELKWGAAGAAEDGDDDDGDAADAAHAAAAPPADTDEAEFAWLPGAALRPFEAGPDGRPPRVNPDGAPAADATLAACVAAAAAALAAPPSPADAPVVDLGSDSDGGWGAAADGGRRRRRPSGGGGADAAAPPPRTVASVLGWRRPSSGDPEGEPEYLVHWTARSHAHDAWLPPSALPRSARRALLAFARAHGGAPCDLTPPHAGVPDRCLARRRAPHGPGWEALVAWRGAGGDAATWEVEGEGVLAAPSSRPLLRALWRQLDAAVARAAPGAADAAAARAGELRAAAAAGALPSLDWPPPWLPRGDKLLSHQRQAVEWLRSRWASGEPACALADDPGLGRAATALVAAAVLRHDWRDGRPTLIMCSSAAMAAWTADLELFSPGARVARLAGLPAARRATLDRELWLAPDSLDGRSTFRVRESLGGRAPAADVVLATFDAVAAEAVALSDVPLALVVLDARSGARRAVARGAAASASLTAGARLLLARGAAPWPAAQPAERGAAADFLWPGAPPAPASLDAALEAATLRRTREAALGAPPPAPGPELDLPTPPTADQAAAARDALARALPALVASRGGPGRVDALRAAVDEQARVAAHAAFAGEAGAVAGGLPSVPRTPPPSGPAAATGSAKLALLARLLPRLRERGAKVALVVAGGDAALDLVARFCEDALPPCATGPGVVVLRRGGGGDRERGGGSTAAAASFNRAGSHTWLAIAPARGLGLGTSLKATTAVVAFDTAWSRRADGGARRKARALGDAAAPPPVLRLIVAGGVEQALLAGPRPVPRRGRAGEAGLEAALRAGGAGLFADARATADAAAAAAVAASAAAKAGGGDAVAPKDEPPKAEPMEVEAGGAADAAPAALPPVPPSPSTALAATADYTDDALDALADWVCAGGARSGPPPSSLPPGATLVAPADDPDGGDDDDDPAAADAGGEPDVAAAAAWWAALLGPTADAAAAAAAAAEAASLAAARAAGGLLHGVHDASSDGGGVEDDGRQGRRRRGDASDDGGAGGAARAHPKRPRGAPAPPPSSPLDAVPLPMIAREWALQETRMRLIADPLSAEGGVARRAYAKIGALARSLALPPAAGELARQAADVLLAGRPDGEPPSDFQDYTVLALVAAAARLAGVRGGAAADPRRLAAAHGQDPDALEAVLDYVMAALNAYRGLCDRVRAAFGAAEDALASRAAGGGGPPPPRSGDRATRSDLDGLAARLAELVAGDFARAAADAGPPEPGSVPALPPPPPDVAASYEAKAEYDALASQIQATCDAIALLDRAHGLRVRAVQDEYAAYMERVRALAQAAIDEANGAFQSTRHGVTVHLDALVALFQARFYAGAPAPGAGAGAGHPAAAAAPAGGGGPAFPGALAASADVLAAHLAAPPGGGGLPLTRLSRDQMSALARQAAATTGGSAATPTPPPTSSPSGGPSKTATVRAGGEERTVVIDADHAALLDAAASAPARPRGARGGPPSPRAGGGAPASPRGESPFAAVAPASPRPPSAQGTPVGAVARESSLREWGASGAAPRGSPGARGLPFAFRPPDGGADGAPASPARLPAQGGGGGRDSKPGGG